MTLSFSTQINSKPTYFPEKIVKGLIENKINVSSGSSDYYLFKADIFCNCKPKLHTIRKDSKNRWIRGRLIHFVINNRTTKRYQFVYNPIPVISTQEIKIIHSDYHGDKGYDKGVWVLVDDIVMSDFQVQQIAINDGFDTVYDFFQWFNSDFSGKIIHWTKLKY